MIYYLNDSNKTQLKKAKRTTLEALNWKEKDLENLIARNIESIISQDSLMTVFQERSGKEEPDILALDKKGDMYILELKRWQSESENLLQALRYGQIFGQHNYEMLNNLFKKLRKNETIELLEEHKKYFDLRKEEEITENHINIKQHFLIVTDGTDADTRQAINYWSSTGLSINAIVYRVFVTETGEKLIEFNTYSPDSDVIELEEGCYILNTNIKSGSSDDPDMVDNGKAAAYYEPWKHKISKIKKGDKVYLYRSRVGIVGMGIGSGVIEKKNYQDKPTEVNEEYNTILKNYVKLVKPLHASNIKKITNIDYRFMSTMFGIGEEKGNLIWDYITKNCL